jgi:hypothetical protein
MSVRLEQRWHLSRKEGMMKHSLLVAVAMLILIPFPTAAAEQGPAISAPAGVVKVARGSVSLGRGEERLPVAVGSLVLVGDVVVTGPDGAVGITLRDNTLLSVGPNSTFSLKKYLFDSSTHEGQIDATISRGTLSVVSGKIGKRSPEAVRLRTPISVIGVRGTEFIISVS